MWRGASLLVNPCGRRRLRTSGDRRSGYLAFGKYKAKAFRLAGVRAFYLCLAGLDRFGSPAVLSGGTPVVEFLPFPFRIPFGSSCLKKTVPNFLRLVERRLAALETDPPLL